MDVDRLRRSVLSMSRVPLQWSHVLMDVDRPVSHGSNRPIRAASMEPRPDGRG